MISQNPHKIHAYTGGMGGNQAEQIFAAMTKDKYIASNNPIEARQVSNKGTAAEMTGNNRSIAQMRTLLYASSLCMIVAGFYFCRECRSVTP